VELAGDSLTFVTPDLTSMAGAATATGLLVSLQEDAGQRNMSVAGPLLFRLLEPLAALGPALVSPCCEFRMSGQETLVISGGLPATSAPARQAIVRFRGETLREEVVAKLATVSKTDGTPPHAWSVHATTPAWSIAEAHVVLEISWNHQQFSQFSDAVRFVEEKSLFGEVAEGLSEEHLPHPGSPEALGPAHGAQSHAQGSDERGVAGGGGNVVQELLTLVDDHQGSPDVPGRGVDWSHVLLMDHEGDAFILARSKDLSYPHQDARLIHDLFLLTCAAALGGTLIARVHAPSVIGYLIAGVIVGPGSLDLVVELVQVESVAELGVCLLLFCLGLELSLTELLHSMQATLAGLLSIVALCCAIVVFAVQCTQTPVHEALCVGLFASLSSTPVSLRATTVQTTEGRGLLAILVTQDIVLAALLASMPCFFQVLIAGTSSARAVDLSPTKAQMGSSTGNREAWTLDSDMVLMCVLAQVVSAWVMCRYWRALAHTFGLAVARLKLWLLSVEGEFFTLVTLSFVFALAYATERLGLSGELGAFVAGLSLASLSEEVVGRTHEQIGGLKDAFTALFYSSVGLVVNARFLFDNMAAVLSVVCFIFVLKVATAFIPLRLLVTGGSSEAPSLVALRLACVLAHVGEFGFVLAARGSAWGLISRHVYLLLVGANVASLCLTPWVFRALERLLPRELDLLPVDLPVASSVHNDHHHDAATGLSSRRGPRASKRPRGEAR